MNLRATPIHGCFELVHEPRADLRGSFVKTFHEPTFRALGLRTDFREEYHSRSHAGVLRGMHVQLPPAAHAKVVTCFDGSVLDVVLDLRVGSPSYLVVAAIPLAADAATSLYVPEGVAHGFVAGPRGALLHYKTTSVHAPDLDAGVLWTSIDFAWPVDAPIVSARDLALPPLSSFVSPFRHAG